MKTLKKVPIELVEIKEGEFIPHELEFGKMYYSKEYSVANHLCLCGCGVQFSKENGQSRMRTAS